MTASEIRLNARKCLTGKWGKAASAALVFSFLTWLISFVLNFIPVVGGIASAIISPVLSFGFLVTMIKLKRNEEISYVGFFQDGFSNFLKVWQVTLWTVVKMLLPILAMVVSFIIIFAATSGSVLLANTGSSSSFITILIAAIGVIAYFASFIWAITKGFLYVLSFYIMNDNPDMLAKEAVERSAELMKGHRGSYLWLNISFIGWMILSIFTLGIGLLWVIPYMKVSIVTFYDELAGNNQLNVEETNEVKSIDPLQ